jgi:hypothetical protein
MTGGLELISLIISSIGLDVFLGLHVCFFQLDSVISLPSFVLRTVDANSKTSDNSLKF